MRDIDINMARVLSVIGGSLLEGEEVRKCDVASLFAFKAEVQRRSANFFLALVDLAEEGRLTKEVFVELYAVYCRELSEGLDKLDTVFYQTMRNIQDHLNEEFLPAPVSEPLAAKNLCRPEFA